MHHFLSNCHLLLARAISSLPSPSLASPPHAQARPGLSFCWHAKGTAYLCRACMSDFERDIGAFPVTFAVPLDFFPFSITSCRATSNQRALE